MHPVYEMELNFVYKKYLMILNSNVSDVRRIVCLMATMATSKKDIENTHKTGR